MNKGYIKLWRKSQDSGLLRNADVWQLLSWCLLNATHKPHKQLVGKQLVELDPGQLIFGRESVASQLNSTVQKIRTSLKTLENVGFLTIRSTNKFSIITIINWGTYQEDQPSNNQQVNTQATIKQPSNNHKQEQKNISTREEKKEHANACLSTDAEASADTPTPDAEQEKAKKQRSDNGFPSCPREKIIDLYHEVLPELPRIRGWSESRGKHLNARWKESMQRLRKAGEPCTEESGLCWWRQFFQRIRAAPHYLHGFQRKDGSYWRPPGLMWFLTPEKFLKIIENAHVESRRAA